MKKPEYIGKLFRQQRKNIPSVVAGSLNANFAGATGIEWTLQDKLFEAIFFHDNAEKIARFDQTGRLTEYRINIPPDEIPVNVKNAVAKELEIMNCILVSISGIKTYELIVRNQKLLRYQLLIDSEGSQINLKIL